MYEILYLREVGLKVEMEPSQVVDYIYYKYIYQVYIKQKF